MKNLFITATRHHEGKTLLAFGIAKALTKHGRRVGYFKPIGHANLEVGEHRVDSDAAFMKDALALEASAHDMSPIVLEGFPVDWTAKGGRERLIEQIRNGHKRSMNRRDVLVIEGTGNAATGAAFDMSNAFIAKMLDARVIIVASGGVGQPADEVILNKSFYERAGVEVLGVIVNKAYPHEFDRLHSFLGPVMESLNARLLGTMPYEPELARPTMRNIQEEFRGRVLNAEQLIGVKLGRFVLGASTAAGTLEQLKGNITLLCPIDREDILMAALSAMLGSPKQGYRLTGVIFSGKGEPEARALALLRRTQVPAIQIELDPFSLASMIHQTSYKLSAGDADRLRRSEELVTKYVQTQRILEGLKD